MKRIFYLITLLAIGSFAQAQSCADFFGVGTYTVTVVCTPSGVSQYPLTFAQLNSTSFTITGLRNESTGTVTATCSDSTFTFPMTALPSGNSVVGMGTFTGTGTINIAYGVYNTGMVQIDSCVGTYSAPIGINNPTPAFFVSVSPNPAMEQVQVAVMNASDLEKCSFEVFDMQGKRVYGGTFKDNSAAILSIADWNAGAYKVVVTNEEGRVVKSLIKQ